ncbi:MAG: hypothetical protein JRH07_00700 [Deltaproteobacteria bacterium]|nr:hypothetical protein [Deltaproteobacteria bacterium]MBW2120352.1 hypothetical protein [Deltaproteobacteria bacterium]
MGEIKSTLEIALEKARSIKISSEDRRRFKGEEARSKAREIFQDYIDHRARSADLGALIEKSGQEPSLLRHHLVEVFLDSLDPARESERIWEGLGELGLKETSPFREALARIGEDEETARREEAQRLEKRLSEALAEAGISGTAVEPNVEGTSEWKEILHSVEKRRSKALQRLRREVSQAIEGDSSFPR